MLAALRPLGSWFLIVVGIGACTRPPVLHSELGEQVAARLCSIQDECGCEEDLLIPNCEREVSGEIARNERRALEAGLVLDEECLQAFLTDVETLASCDPSIQARSGDCFVYHGQARVGEPCVHYELFPRMSDCQQGLECRVGACRDLDNPRILQEGELCSETQGLFPSGFLGDCAPGLVCDSLDTRTCIPGEPLSLVPLGGQCEELYLCESGTYCRPPDGADDVSEQSPGICSAPTPAGQPCSLAYECERFCEDGLCQQSPPLLCEVLDDWASTREIIAQGEA